MTNKEIEKRLVELRRFIYKDHWDHNRTRQTLDVLLGLIIGLIPETRGHLFGDRESETQKE